MRASSSLPAARPDGSPNRDFQVAAYVSDSLLLNPAAGYNTEETCRNRGVEQSSEESVEALRKQGVRFDLEVDTGNQEAHCGPTVPVEKPAAN